MNLLKNATTKNIQVKIIPFFLLNTQKCIEKYSEVATLKFNTTSF